MIGFYAVGRLTRDPELRNLASGTSVCTFGLAVDRAGDKQDDGSIGAGFFDVTLWGKTAETAAQYLAKGRQVALQGELKHHKWTSESGENRQKVELHARSMTFCGSKNDGGDGGGGFTPAAQTSNADFSPPDDDIPF